jgi:hypothetical protein
MTKQSTLSRSCKSIAGAALVGLGLLALFGDLDGAAAELSCPLATTAGEALGLLPSVVLAAAWHALPFQGFIQMLVPFWLLLFILAAAILLRAVCKGKVGVFPEPSKYQGE